MISEEICIAVLKEIHGYVTVYSERTDLGRPTGPTETSHEVRDARSERDLIRPLLAWYTLPDIEAAIRWLELGGYVGRTQWGINGPWLYVLTAQGLSVARAGTFSEDERALFYRDDPHQVFLAHQFRPEDEPLRTHLVNVVLGPAGYRVVDGRADGLEQFRTAIIAKINASRFFLCLLTHRARLESRLYASSVWLYQEIGAAVALGRPPLVLIEDGIDPHYAGELQKTYEYIPFNRETFAGAVEQVPGRFDADLERHHIPRPTRPIGAA